MVCRTKNGTLTYFRKEIAYQDENCKKDIEKNLRGERVRLIWEIYETDDVCTILLISLSEMRTWVRKG